MSFIVTPQLLPIPTAAFVSNAAALSIPTTAFPVIAEFDILCVAVNSSNQTISTPTSTGLTFAEITAQVGTGTGGAAGSVRLALFWARIPNAWTPAAISVADSGDHNLGAAFVVRGCPRTGSPFDVVNSISVEETSDTSGVIPGLTTTSDKTLVIDIASRGNDSASATSYSAWTNASLAHLKEYREGGTTVGTGGGIAIHGASKETLGTVSNTTFTQSTASLKAFCKVAFAPYIDTDLTLIIHEESAPFSNTEMGWAPPTNVIIKDNGGNGELFTVIPINGTAEANLWKSADDGKTWAIVSGASVDYVAFNYSLKQDASGKCHFLHYYGGGDCYARFSLVRTSGAITGWTWETSSIYLPTVGAGDYTHWRDLQILEDGLGNERVFCFGTNGDNAGTWRGIICHGPLTTSSASDFLDLSGSVGGTALTTRTQSPASEAPYECGVHGEQIGTAGNIVVAYGVSGTGHAGEFGAPVECQILTASSSNWTVGSVQTLRTQSYQTQLGSSNSVGGNAYFVTASRTAEYINGTIQIARVASDGIITQSITDPFTFGQYGSQPRPQIVVTSDEKIIMLVDPLSEATTVGQEQLISAVWDGTDWESFPIRSSKYIGERVDFCGGCTGWDRGLAFVTSVYGDSGSDDWDVQFGSIIYETSAQPIELEAIVENTDQVLGALTVLSTELKAVIENTDQALVDLTVSRPLAASVDNTDQIVGNLVNTDAVITINEASTPFANTEISWAPSTAVIVRDSGGNHELFTVITVTGGASSDLWTSSDDGKTWSIVSGTSIDYVTRNFALKQDSAGNCHFLHYYGGGDCYARFSLTRTGGEITGWTWLTSSMYLPTVGAGTVTRWRDLQVILNGNAAERVLVVGTNGDNAGTWRAIVTHAPLDVTATAGFLDLSGVTGGTALTTRVQNPLSEAAYECVVHGEQIGTVGNVVVAYGVSGTGHSGDHGLAAECQILTASDSNWTVGNVQTLCAQSYQTHVGGSATVNGNAYFVTSARTADYISGEIYIAQVAADGTITQSIVDPLAFGQYGSQPRPQIVVTANEQIILVIDPLGEANTPGNEQVIGAVWDGTAWTTFPVRSAENIGERVVFCGGSTGWDNGLAFVISAYGGDDSTDDYRAQFGSIIYETPAQPIELEAIVENTDQILGSLTVARPVSAIIENTDQVLGNLIVDRKLSVTIENDDQILGALTVVRQLATSVDNTDQILGNLIVDRKLSATIDNTDQILGVLTVSRPLAAIIENTDQILGNLIADRKLSATINNTDQVLGALTVARPLAAIIENNDQVLGNLIVDRKLLATIDNTDQILGALTVDRPLTAVIENTDQVLGNLIVNRELSATIENNDQVLGALTITSPLSAIIENTDQVLGNLIVTRELSIALDNTDQILGTLKVVRPVSAIIENTDQILSNLIVDRKLSATIDNNDQVLGVLTVARPLAAIIENNDQVLGNLIVDRKLLATIDNTDQILGALTVAHQLVASVNNTDQILGNLIVDRKLSATIENDDQILGALTVVRQLSAIIENTDQVLGNLIVDRKLSVTIENNDQLLGALTVVHQLATSVNNTDQILGVLTVSRPLTTIIENNDQVLGNLIVARELSATIDNTDQVLGELKTDRGISAKINENNQIVGNLIVTRELSALIGNSDQVLGTLALARPVSAIIENTDQILGNLIVDRKLSATINNTNQVLGALTIARPLSAIIENTDQVLGNLIVTRELSIALDNTDQILGALKTNLGLSVEINENDQILGALTAARPLSTSIENTDQVLGNLIATRELSIALDNTDQILGALKVAHPLSAIIENTDQVLGGLSVTRELSATIDEHDELTANLLVGLAVVLSASINESEQVLANILKERSLFASIEEPDQIFANIFVEHLLSASIQEGEQVIASLRSWLFSSQCIPALTRTFDRSLHGLRTVASLGDGYSVALEWHKAFLLNPTGWDLYYNIYYSSEKKDVFTEGVKFVVPGTQLTTTIRNTFKRGNIYYFAVRSTAHEAGTLQYNSLPEYDGMRIYPEAGLREDISATDLIIPVDDASVFPSTGIILIGAEPIAYSAVDLVDNNLLLFSINQRGLYGYDARIHTTNGYDGVHYFNNPFVQLWYGFEDGNTVQGLEEIKFELQYARTNEDGYRERVDIVSSENDLKVVEDANEGFPAYDLAGYDRTYMGDYLSGKCVGTYFGGEYGCADGYDNGDGAIRGLSIQDHTNMREEYLLELTGEPVVLFKRQWSGKESFLHDSTRENTIHRGLDTYGTTLVSGYEQYFNQRRSDGKILVRFGPTKEDIKREESGLENTFIPNCWTLVTPSIKDGDFFIRFSQDGTVEWRYEIIDVERNRTLLEESGLQKFTSVRVRKTDPIYQVRSIRDTSMYPITIMTGLGSVSGPGGIPPHMHRLVRSEGKSLSQMTSIVQGHNHPVYDDGNIVSVGIVLGHQHDLII
jgi:hypothetical protein